MKDKRQARILEIVAHKAIETQEQLMAELESAGFPVTQSTISRDIKDLGLVKSPLGDGRLAYTQLESQAGYSLTDRMVRTLRNAVLSIDYSGTFIVVKTFTGAANAAAAALDSLDYPEVLGSIAGDDTILIIMRDAEMTPIVTERLRQLAER